MPPHGVRQQVTGKASDACKHNAKNLEKNNGISMDFSNQLPGKTSHYIPNPGEGKYISARDHLFKADEECNAASDTTGIIVLNP